MIIVDRASGEETRIVTPPTIHRRLAAEPFRVGRILEQEAQFLRKIFWIIGPADKSVDTILNDLGECSRGRRDERASLRHGFRRGQSEGFIPRADHRDRCLAAKAGKGRMGLMIEPLDPAGLPGPGDPVVGVVPDRPRPAVAVRDPSIRPDEAKAGLGDPFDNPAERIDDDIATFMEIKSPDEENLIGLALRRVPAAPTGTSGTGCGITSACSRANP